MVDNEYRRLELKSQILATEISQLEASSRELGQELKRRELKFQKNERSWVEFLKNSIAAYKKANPKLQTQIFHSNLLTLSKAKKLLFENRKKELQLRSKLNDIAVVCKSKTNQLNHCITKKKSNINIKLQRAQQNISDELAILKIIKNDSDSNFNQKISDKNDLTAQSAKSSTSENQAMQESSPILADSSLTNSVQTQVFSENTEMQPDSQPDPRQSQQKWEDAKQSQEIISSQNEQVKVALLQTSEGQSLCLDFLLTPGRLISIAGNKAAKSQSVSLHLDASNNADKNKLKTEKANLLLELQTRGVSVSKLEVS